MSPKDDSKQRNRWFQKALRKLPFRGPPRNQAPASTQLERQEDRREDRPVAKDPSCGTAGVQPHANSSEEDIKTEAEGANSSATASPEKHCSPPNGAVHAQNPSVEQHGAGKSSTAQGTTQSPPVSKSQEIWNDAFSRIEDDPDAKELIEKYMKILKGVSGSVEKNGGPVGDTEAEPSSVAARQRQMVQLVKEGQEKIKKASKITKSVGQFVEAILVAKPLVDLVIQNVPHAAPAALPWAGVCAALQMLCKPAQANNTNLEGVKYVVSRMEWYCALTDRLLDTGSIESGNKPTEEVLGLLREKVVSLYRELLLFLIQSVCSYHSHQGVVFFKHALGREDWTASLTSIKAAESTLQTDSDQYNKLHARTALQECSDRARGMMELLGDVDKTIRASVTEQRRMKREETDKSFLQKLFVVDPQDDMDKIEERKDALLDDAFKWILDMREFKAFTDDTAAATQDDNNDGSYGDDSALVRPPPLSCRLLWIKGNAGTGKTMLLLGIIRTLSARSAALNPSISHFFFQATDKTLNSNTAALRSLLWMLLLQQPHLLSHLRTKYETALPSFDDDRAFISLSKVFKSMLADPDLKPVYFIVDALDECDQGLPEFIRLISTSLALSDKVKWLVSSRPTVPLRTEEAANSLVELDSQKLNGPVAAYIHYQLSRLAVSHGYTEAIIKAVSREVTSRAQNTFLWVWFVFQQLSKPDKRGKMLDGSHALTVVKRFPPGLSALYGRIMDMIEEGREDDPEYCKATLKAVYLAYRPLSLSELATLVSFPQQQVARIVDECGSLLTVTNNTVNLIHQSAKDYLQDNYSSRLGSDGVAQGHAAMSQHCLNAMSGLRKNMYCLQSLGPYPRDAAIPQPDPLAPMRYACVHWVNHLGDASDQLSMHDGSEPNTKRVYSFLQEHVLHWIEGLSLLNRLSDGIASIRKLLRLVPACEEASELSDFVLDTLRFILSNRFCIETAPLQTYASVLLFSPTNSKVRKHFEKNELDWIKTKPVVEAEWDSCIQTLEGHNEGVTSVVFSPDGEQLASSSDDGTVKVWDVALGECTKTLEGHNNFVTSVVFSPDGKQLASSSNDGTVKVWDVALGECTKTLEGHDDYVTSVVFLRDGKQLTSSSKHKTVKVWNVASGECIKTLEGHNDLVMSVVFSQNGKQLASGSVDQTVKVWDVASGECTKTLEGHNGWVTSVVFSRNGKQLASVSRDETVKVWDVASGECTKTLKGPNDYMTSVVFSQDGKQLASSSYGTTVKVWNVASGECTKTLEGHNDFVTSVVFSRNGKQLASGSKDRTVKVWDVLKECTKTFEGYNGSVTLVVFSQDGKQLASGFNDGTVEVWNVSGKCTKTLKGHNDWVTSVVFSQDGKQLASGSDDETVKVWDLASGKCIKTLKGHNHVTSVVFSQDGKQLAAGSYNTTVKVWDVASEECIKTFENYTSRVTSAVFSRDGKQLDRTQRDEESHQLSGLHLDGPWILRDGQKLLWLPTSYRPEKFTIQGQTVGLGLKAGRVIILQF